MILNYLYVTLHPESLEYLQTITAAHPPVQIDWEPKIEVLVSPDEIDTNPNAVYLASPTGFDAWYSSGIGASSGIISLDSESLLTRNAQLISQGIRPAFQQTYNPHVTLIPYLPPMRRNIKAWMNSIGNTLNISEPLMFTGETVVVQDFSFPLDVEYNQAMEGR